MDVSYDSHRKTLNGSQFPAIMSFLVVDSVSSFWLDEVGDGLTHGSSICCTYEHIFTAGCTLELT